MWYNLNEMGTMEYVDFGSLVNIKSSKRIYASDYCKNGIPFFRGKEITNIAKTKEFLYISKEKYQFIKDNYGVPKENDLLITAVGTIGNTWIVDKREFYFKDGNILWIENYNNINSLYLKYSLDYSIKKINSNSNGSSQSAITMDVLKNVKVKKVDNKLMSYIGNLLSTMDKLIEDKESLIKNIQNEKKKLHHRIFERTENSNECKIKLNDVASIISHQSLSKFISDDQNGYKIIDMGAISSDGRIISTKYTDRKIQALEIGDLVMVKDDIGGGNIIGATVYIDDTNCVCGDHVYRIIINNEFCSSYVQKVINSPSIRKQLRSKANGTAQLGLGKKAVEDVLIPVIPLNEQEKIANLLSSMDKIIDLHKQELEQLKLKKKYYLNKIFN